MREMSPFQQFIVPAFQNGDSLYVGNDMFVEAVRTKYPEG
jgi:hypothetical protein